MGCKGYLPYNEERRETFPRGMINGENVGEDVCGSPLTSVLYHIFFENFVTQVTQYRKRYTNNKFLPIFFVHPGE